VTPLVASGVSGAIHAGGLAATTIAEALASGRSDTEALWPYAARYQRGRGAIMASYDVSRRITETFTEGMINDLLESGASHPEDAIGPAIPRAFTFSLASLPGRIKGLMTHPRLIPAVVRMGVRSAAAYRHYRTYPVRYDPAALAAWSARAASIFDGIGPH
jgi:flavin-dependent dehydrogenase